MPAYCRVWGNKAMSFLRERLGELCNAPKKRISENGRIVYRPLQKTIHVTLFAQKSNLHVDGLLFFVAETERRTMETHIIFMMQLSHDEIIALAKVIAPAMEALWENPERTQDETITLLNLGNIVVKLPDIEELVKMSCVERKNI